jgi:hypothetical protein
MSGIFDAMHRAMFDKLFSLDAEGWEAKAKRRLERYMRFARKSSATTNMEEQWDLWRP